MKAKKKLIRILEILIVTLFVGIILVVIFYYFAFRGTAWGGWEPPDVSLKLNTKEKKWVENIEKKYECSFDYIGLDYGFTEDSIIHIDLNCHNTLMEENHLLIDKEAFTKNLCNTFLSCSTNKRSQKFIKFTYKNLKIEGVNHPVTRDFFYYKNIDSIVQLE